MYLQLIDYELFINTHKTSYFWWKNIFTTSQILSNLHIH